LETEVNHHTKLYCKVCSSYWGYCTCM